MELISGGPYNRVYFSVHSQRTPERRFNLRGSGRLNKWEGGGLKGTFYGTYPPLSAAGLKQTGENCSSDANPIRNSVQDKHDYDNCQLCTIVVVILESVTGNEKNLHAVNYGDNSTKRNGYDGKSHVNTSLNNERNANKKQ